MNIIKIGGSIINPDGRYDLAAIRELISLVQNKEKYIFVVGGGKLCRKIQEAVRPLLMNALEDVATANDTLGIAVTQINARHVLQQFKKKLGKEVHPEILLDPTWKIQSKARIFFIGGWKPGHSTDKDMMMLAQTYQAARVIKVSNFEMVKDVHPLELNGLPETEKLKRLVRAAELPQLTWKQLKDLVGTTWMPGLNTPFDPRAVELGYTLRKKVALYIGKKEELGKMLQGQKFRGTVVQG